MQVKAVKEQRIAKVCCVYAKGLNIQGQLGLKGKVNGVQEYEPIPLLQDLDIDMMETNYSQNACIINQKSLVFWGWPLCLRTTLKYINRYEYIPTVTKILQKLTPHKLGILEPTVQADFPDRITEMKMSPGYFNFLDEKNRVWGWGENRFGQMGLGHILYPKEPVHIPFFMEHGIKQIYGGLQHALYLGSRGQVYGCGQSQRFQLGREKSLCNAKEIAPFPLLLRIPESIIQVGAGIYFSILLGESGSMYAVGMNNYGQCGFPNTLNMQIEHFAKIYMPGQLKVTQIAIGDHHALCLAEDGNVYAFGAMQDGQIDGIINGIRREQCSPIKVEIPTKGVPIVRIKARNQKSAIFLENGDIWYWGGSYYKRNKRFGIKGFKLLHQEEDLMKLLQKNEKVINLGLGFGHFTVLTQKF